MEILVIDGQGGGLGRQLVAALRKAMPEAELMAVGTNSAATEAMRKAGASRAATGENALAVACRPAAGHEGPRGRGLAAASPAGEPHTFCRIPKISGMFCFFCCGMAALRRRRGRLPAGPCLLIIPAAPRRCQALPPQKTG